MLNKLLIILPALILATGIEIEIKGEFKDTKSNLDALLYGEDIKIASIKERNLFGIDNDTIKESINIIYGGRPDDVFISSPTPWGDLYKTYAWDQVQRTLLPTDAAILDISSKQETITEKVFGNNSTKPIKVNVALFKDVETLITSTWTKPADLNVDDVNYRFALNVEGVDIVYSHTFVWAQDGKWSRNESLGSASELNLILQPDQVVTAKLEARKAVISVKIDYEVNLEGTVVANYAFPFKGHHFYKFDVNDVLINKNLNLDAKASQTLTLVFYYDSKIVAIDQKTDTQLIELKLARAPSPKHKDLERTGVLNTVKLEVPNKS